MERWHDRINKLMGQAGAVSEDDTSSQFLRNSNFWHPDDPLDEGELVGWIFIYEDEGMRMK